MHLDHGKCIALTIGEKRGAQPIGFLGIGETAGCQLQECRGCRAAIGNILKIVIAKTRTEGRGNGLDRIAEVEFGKVDGAAHDRQQVHQAGDDGIERLAEVGKLSGQFSQPCLFVSRIDDDRAIERVEGLYQRFCEPASWVLVTSSARNSR